MRNVGKIFEEQIKKSTPPYCLFYRLPDTGQAYGGQGNLRFSLKNPFDAQIWDSKGHVLYAIELKSVSGKSISFERTKKDKGVIHLHQVEGLTEWSSYDGIVAGFILEFREIPTTIFLNIKDFNRLIELIAKKSFNLKDLDDNSIPYIVIAQTKARTRYLYDVDCFLTKIRESK